MTTHRRRAPAQALLAAALAVGATWAADIPAPAQAQTPPPSPVGAAPAAKPSVSTKEPIRPAQVRSAPPPRAETRPTWAELTPQQQQALAPLAGSWRSMGEARKRKWLAVSANFRTMTPAEQALLHSRMSEWAELSPQQRDAARLNYGEARKVSPDDKRAKWEAYQALPPEEKRRLAAGATAAKPPPPPTAMAVKPVPQHELAKIQKPRKAEGNARADVVPTRADNHTPLPPPSPAASAHP